MNFIDFSGLKCRKKLMLLTAYCVKGTGSDWTFYKPKKKGGKPGKVGPGTIAVADTDPIPYPYGSKVTVYGSDGDILYQGVVHDTGAGWDAEHHNVPADAWIDIWLKSCKKARKWGKQWREVEICDDCR